MARDELNTLKQVVTKKDNSFQQYLTKFQNLIAQSQAGDIPEIQRLFAEGLNIQIATMIYPMENVPDTLKGWIDKAIDFHWQKACIITLKKEHGLPISSFSSTPHSTRDPDAMDVDFICLKKHSPADHTYCIWEGLCFKCHKKGHNAEQCRSARTQEESKRSNRLQQVRVTETSSSTTSTTATIAPVTPINTYIQNLTTIGF